MAGWKPKEIIVHEKVKDLQVLPRPPNMCYICLLKGDGPMHPKILKIVRMTKKFLFSLNEGLYLVSNIYILDESPIPKPHAFMEYVAPLEQREAQWKRIKKVGADGRTFTIFNDEADFCMYNDDFIKHNMHRAKEFGWC